MLPTWSVLLVGGSSATGKTTATRALAHHYGVSVLQTDDVRMALQQMTTPAQHPCPGYFAHPFVKIDDLPSHDGIL